MADAEARYRVITRAFEVLSDEDARRVYDALGEDGVMQMQEQQEVPPTA